MSVLYNINEVDADANRRVRRRRGAADRNTVADRCVTGHPSFRTTWFLALSLAAVAALFTVAVAVERQRSDHHTEVSATVMTLHEDPVARPT